MKILKNTTYNEMVSRNKALEEEIKLLKQKIIDVDGKQTPITPGPSSSRDLPKNALQSLQKSLNIVDPQFQFDAIPVIRKLSIVNMDVNQALNDLTRLANTGHKIKFNPEVDPKQIDEMRDFISNSSKHWHVGAAGASSVVNKTFRQIMIGGALAKEWVPNLSLNDIEEVRFINPESIRFVIEKNTRGYQPYQKLKNTPITDITRDLRKLNTSQFRYFALNGDTDVPYGIPPYIAALDPISIQRGMIQNLKFITKYLGTFGFMDARMEKPVKQPNESEQAYLNRIETMLTEFKQRVLNSIADGVIVGIKEDHEFEFHNTTKDAKGAKDIFDLNEQLVASGLNYDAVFMGRPGATETLVTIMFTKMLAQLKNVQDIVKEDLEFGYRLALTLAGFKFKNLSVEFNRSTITDDLKFQQAQEILIRNLVVKYQYGIINLEQFADELGYLASDQKEPRININQDDPIGDSTRREKREKDKDKSDKSSRSKSKPQGTTRRQNSAPYVDEEKGLRIIRIA